MDCDQKIVKSFEEWSGYSPDFNISAFQAWKAATEIERARCKKVIEEIGPKEGPLSLVTKGFAEALDI